MTIRQLIDAHLLYAERERLGELTGVDFPNWEYVRARLAHDLKALGRPVRYRGRTWTAETLGDQTVPEARPAAMRRKGGGA